MKKKDDRWKSNGDDTEVNDGPARCGIDSGELLESAIGELLATEPDFETPGTSKSQVNGGNGKNRRTQQEEIESLIERMVFCEQTFVKYTH